MSGWQGTRLENLLARARRDTSSSPAPGRTCPIEHTRARAPTRATAMVVPEDGCSTMNADWHNASINFALQNVSDGDATRLGRGQSSALGAMKTRAAVFFAGRRRPLEVVELELAEPRPARSLVRMAAVGICGTDLHTGEGRVAAADADGARARGRGRRRGAWARASRRVARRRRGRALVGAVVRRVRRLPARPAGRAACRCTVRSARHARRRDDRHVARRRDGVPRTATGAWPSGSSSPRASRCPTGGGVPLRAGGAARVAPP